MKKLCSGLLVVSIALSQVGTRGCALEKNVNAAPRVTQEKTSWLRENSQKNNINLQRIYVYLNELNNYNSRQSQ